MPAVVSYTAGAAAKADEPAAARGSRPIECPRCGYDLAGMAASWAEQCPIAGSCSECGLSLEWREVLNRRFASPRWSIEAGRTDIAYWRAAIATLAHMFRPWRFWRAMSMSLQPRWGRLILFPVVLAPFMYVVFALSVGIGVYHGASFGASSPISVRAGLAGFHAALLPFSTSTNVAGTSPPRSPAQIAASYEPRIISEGWKSVRRGSFGRYPRSFLPSGPLLLACLTVILCPLSFALLPQSRRAAKVRWRHIFRIAIYSAVFLAIPVSLDMLMQLSGIWQLRTATGSIVGVLTTLLVLIAWWTAATSRYLRMPHAWGVGLMAVGLAFVIELFALACVDFVLDLRYLF